MSQSVSYIYQLECEVRRLEEKAGWFDEMIEETKKCRLEGGKTVVGQVFVTLKQENKQLKKDKEDAEKKNLIMWGKLTKIKELANSSEYDGNWIRETIREMLESE